MSGPKGISYTVESAAQRARRELLEAQSRVRTHRATIAQIRAQAGVLGIKAGRDRGVPSTIDGCQAALAELDREASRLQMAIRDAMAASAREFLASALDHTVEAEGVDLGLKERTRATATPDLPASAPVHEQLGRDSGQMVEDVTRVLVRLEKRDEAISLLAKQVLESPIATSRLLLQRLSGEVDRINTRLHLAREEAAALAERAEKTQLREVVQASEEEFVLTQVVESLEELGYVVSGTSVTAPRQLVLTGGGQHGYGLAAGVAGGGEIVLRPVRTDPSVPHADRLAEETFCAQLPAFSEELGRRGVVPGRIRAMPVGVVPVPLESTQVAPDVAAQRTLRKRSVSERKA